MRRNGEHDKRSDRQRGYSLIELLMVLLLLTLFGVTTFTLIYSGSGTYQKIADTQTTQVNARVALGYLDVLIRQNDRSGAISIEPNPIDGQGSALKIQRDEGLFQIDTWVFLYDGILRECMTDRDELVDISLASDIVPVSEFNIFYDQSGRVINIWVSDLEGKGRAARHHVSIGLRSQ